MENTNLFDFNCDAAQSYGIYKNDLELEMAKYASSINISAGFHSGDPMKIRAALLFAKDNNIALGAHIGYPDIQGFGKRKMDLSKEELEAVVIYQVGAIVAYAKNYDLEIEQVRCHGALKDTLNSNEEDASVIVEAIKKISPWLNLIVQKPETKDFVQSLGLKSAYELDYFEEILLNKDIQNKPDTIHFRTLEDIKKAYEIIKPTPINYNRVQEQI